MLYGCAMMRPLTCEIRSFARRLPLTYEIRSFARQLRYRGNNVECPACQNTFTRFKRRGPNQLCPGCDAAERHRALALQVDQELANPNIRRVLHLAPERGLSRRLRRHPGIEYVTGDAKLWRGVDRKLDVMSLTDPDGSWDLLLCSHVLQYVPDDRAAVREIVRVLGPGGIALILVPIDPGAPATERCEDSPLNGVRVFGQDTFERFRVSAGVSVEQIDYERMLPPSRVARLGLADRGQRPGATIFRFAKGLT
jgi:SAM-dependent methyltransferase